MNPAQKAKAIVIAGKIARIALDVALGDRDDATEAAKDILGMLTDMIPVDELKPFLSEQSRRFIDLENDVIEQLKLMGKEP